MREVMVNYEKIRSLAKQRGITIAHICRELGHNHTYINSMEKRGYDLPEESILTIAKLLNTTYQYLVDMTDNPDPHYLVKEAESVGEKIVLRSMELIGELSEKQLETYLNLLSLPAEQFSKVIEAIEMLRNI